MNIQRYSQVSLKKWPRRWRRRDKVEDIPPRLHDFLFACRKYMPPFLMEESHAIENHFTAG